MEKHRVLEENAAKFAEWIRTRGGVAVWGCLDLSDLSRSWSSPVRTEDGQPTPKPHWAATNEPVRVITDLAEIVVDVPKEVKRFHVAVRMGSQGMRIKLTDASSKRVHKEVAKAGENAWYEFDYGTQEAVILVPATEVPLDEWMKTPVKWA